MSGEPPLVYLDASVFLAHFKGEAGRVQDCQAVFSEARDGKIRAATSVLSLIEANRGTSLADEEIEKIDAFFEHSWLRAVTLDRRIAIKARRLAREHKLKAPDAIHLATAIISGAHMCYPDSRNKPPRSWRICLKTRAPDWAPIFAPGTGSTK